MTLTRFVTKNAFRNKRRSVLTALSIAFSLLLLTIMMTVWRAFYLEQGSPESAQRLIVRHKVSLVFFLPGYYREKNSGPPRRQAGCARNLVRRDLQGQQAGEFFRSVWHRSQRTDEGLSRIQPASRPA